MAELDLFRLICKTLISLLFSRGSGIVDKGAVVGNCSDMMLLASDTAVDNGSKMMLVSDAEAAGPPQFGTAVPFWS